MSLFLCTRRENVYNGTELEGGSGMNKEKVETLLPENCVVGGTLLCFECMDSTNDYLKNLALQGGKHGTVVLADGQTGGRGRMGRRFESPNGAGIYLSVLLRPACLPAEAVDLTAWAAVAVCDGLKVCCGVETDIKWTNDLLLHGRKLCGILTELVMDGEQPCIILGIGLNVTQSRAEFDVLGLGEIATSLAAEGVTVEREAVAASIIRSLDKMVAEFPHMRQAWLECYRERCVSVNKPVTILRGGEHYVAFALAVEEDFTLRVRRENGVEECLSAGEVSVRGLMGYQ